MAGIFKDTDLSGGAWPALLGKEHIVTLAALARRVEVDGGYTLIFDI
jgi:hypothetical protein